jgi:hypothetical protein
MVYRWSLDTQAYDYTFQDILGKDNPVADGFSRLVADNMSYTEVIATLLPPPKIPAHLHVLIGIASQVIMD